MLPKLITPYFCLIFCTLIFNVSLSQQQENNEVQNLNQQYNTLIESSETFNEYKVIKRNKLNSFWKIVTDSVEQTDKLRKEALVTIEAKKAQIEELNNVIQQKDQDLAAGEEEKSSITVLGARINKSSYAIISVIIPIILIAVIGMLIAKFKVDRQTAKIAKQHLFALEKEFEDYKKRAMDNQIKLNRELQTERNKLQELNR